MRVLLAFLALSSLARAEVGTPSCSLSFVDKGTGGAIADRSGSGHDAVLHGAQWIKSSAFGGCLSFNGLDQYAEIRDSGDMNYSEAFTISTVARVGGTQLQRGTVGALIAKWLPTGKPETMSYALLHDGNSFRMRLSDGREQLWLDAAVPDTGWHHIMSTFGGGWAKLYLDGKLRARREAPFRIHATRCPVRIGSASDGNWRLRGMIREVKLWNRMLEKGELTREFQVARETMVSLHSGPGAGSREAVAGVVPALRRENVVVRPAVEPWVVPRPRQMRFTGTAFELDSATVIVAQHPDEVAIGTLRSQIQEAFGVAVSLSKAPAPGRNSIVVGDIGSPIIEASEAPSLSSVPEGMTDEGYVLSADSDRVVVAGKSTRGTFYGVQTLLQLITAKGDRIVIPGVEIVDWPAMHVRGMHISLRVAGQKTNVPLAKDVIARVLARYKYNVLVLEVEGGMQFSSHPGISHPLALSKDEVTEIVEWARMHHMEVIPQMQSLGHCDYWLLKAYPELAEDRSSPYNYDPSNPRVYSILFELFEEVIEVFKPRRFHIGHDEVGETLGSSPSANGKLPYEWFAADVQKLHGFLRERGIRTMMWGDMLLGGWNPGAPGWRKAIARAIDSIPRDVMICDWHYGRARAYPSLEHFRQKGFEVIATPWYGRENNLYFAQAARDAGALGMIGSRWDGNRAVVDSAASLRSNGFLLTAEYAWSPGLPPLERLPDRGAITQRIADDLHPIGAAHVGLLLDLSRLPTQALDASMDWLLYPGTGDLGGTLPMGEQRLGGVLFRISEKAGAACGVALAGATSPSLPTRVRIPIGKKLRAAFFLHTCGWLVPRDGSEVGSYEIVFADGKKERIPLLVGRNIAELTRPVEYWGGEAPAWKGRTKAGEPVMMWTAKWRNPRPRQMVSEIIFSAAGRATPVLLALTLVPAGP